MDSRFHGNDRGGGNDRRGRRGSGNDRDGRRGSGNDRGEAGRIEKEKGKDRGERAGKTERAGRTEEEGLA